MLIIDQILDNDNDPLTKGFRQEDDGTNLSGVYQSSTQWHNSTHIYTFHFTNGHTNITGKTSNFRVRAIRKF